MRARLQTALLLGPPAFGAALAGMLVGLARKLTVDFDAPFVPDFVVLLSVAGATSLALAIYLIGAARVRRGAPTDFPRSWRLVPWTAAAGFAFGLITAVTHALLK